MRAEPRRWRTRFGRWVRRVGVQRITMELSRAGEPITPGAVYQWVSGQRAPRAGRAIAMVRMSSGAIVLGDIYRHAVTIRKPWHPEPGP